MEINKYRIFLEVARQNSLSKAAEALGYTQSGISHTLKRFEQETNLTLFDRNRTGAFLTASGQELYPYISALVQSQESLTQAIHSLHNLKKGSLNIGSYSSIARNWLPSIIQLFKKDFPSISIHFKEGGNEDMLEWLKNREVDLAFCSYGFEENLEWIPLKEDPLMAVLPKDYPITFDHFPIEEFNEKVFIISELGTDIDIHRTLANHQVTPDIQYSAIDDNTIVAMVSHHLGISILPNLILQGQQEQILALPLQPYTTRQLGIAVPSMEQASPAALEFISYTKEWLSHLLL